MVNLHNHYASVHTALTLTTSQGSESPATCLLAERERVERESGELDGSSFHVQHRILSQAHTYT